ncbi:HK97 family phage portal protein [Roseibium hamelinense]|uniref:HK97 family phage portal protein n=1 Tax=Roseibium hamelinense TaxID=150831 RepID=A0A562T9B5_9HYPH|nr:phage portal protein [Roseibium hamelinense]MTI43690.1 phage portal protein [Roseibium hamelinense]TWI89370.1 HK97 family phage portal protein [Roseibium hamelinense]
MRLGKAFDAVFARRDSAAEEHKASRVGPLLALHGKAQPVWSPRNYTALAREGFAKNPVVYRAVRMVSEAAASVQLTLFDGAQELATHPLLELIALPNPEETQADFLERLYGHLLTSGNAYLEQVSLNGEPRELHALRPDRVKVVPGPEGWPEAFDYTVGGRSIRLSALPEEGGGNGPAQMRHLKLFHPLNDHYGFAPIEAAQMSLDIHNAAGSWNKALLDNAARPSGALIYGAGDAVNLSGDQFDRLKDELEAGYQGARNAGRPLLLEGGLDWKPMGLTPKDMDFIEAKNQAAREIALAFGVPPMLLAIPGDNTYANYQEANRAFWRNAVLPLVRRVSASLTAWLSPAYGQALTLEPDLDAIEALAPEREALWRRVGAANYLDDDEKRAAVGYGARQDGHAQPPLDKDPADD